MRILITGALGYVGSRLIQEFKRRCPTSSLVLLASRFSTRQPLPFEAPVQYTGPLEDAPWDELLPNVDVVIHLAGTSDSSGSFQKDLEMNRILENTRHTAWSCAQHKVPLLFLSSSSLYPPGPAPYEDGPLPPRLTPPTPYAATKWAEENEIAQLSRDQGLRFTVLRCASVFGPSPRMRYHTALNRFCLQAIQKEPLSLWKTAAFQTKPYLEISDLVSTIADFTQNRRFENQFCNVFSFHARMDEILETLRASTGSVSIDWVDSPAMTRGSLWLKRTELDTLGLTFQTCLGKSVRATLDWIADAENFHPNPADLNSLRLKQG